jgi:LPXTG-motif cell wall-anchored protein
MTTSITASILASITPVAVPDTGASGLLFGLGVLSLGLVARFLKKRKR